MNSENVSHKLRVCDECGFRIEDGVGTHDRCDDDEEEQELNQGPQYEPLDSYDERNPLECPCPECESPKMDGARFCIKCYTEGCNAQTTKSGGEPRCPY